VENINRKIFVDRRQKKRLRIRNLLLIIFLGMILLLSGCINGLFNNNDNNHDGDFQNRFVLRDVNCMEFDYERNILLISTFLEFAFYYPENNNFEIILDYPISEIAIDYKHDIYYLSTFSSGDNVIKKYFIGNKTIMDYPITLSKNSGVGGLTYNEYTDELIIDIYYNDVNIAYYDNLTKQLFNFRCNCYLDNSKGELLVTNYLLNNTKTIPIDEIVTPENNFTQNEIYEILYGISAEITDIIYDSATNTLFIGIWYEDSVEILCSLIYIDLNTESVSKVVLPVSQGTTGILDMCINAKTNELYLATNFGLYTFNTISKELVRIDSNYFDIEYISHITYDPNDEKLYLINSPYGIDSLLYYSIINSSFVKII
jgi:hypothetical protein